MICPGILALQIMDMFISLYSSFTSELIHKSPVYIYKNSSQVAIDCSLVLLNVVISVITQFLLLVN